MGFLVQVEQQGKNLLDHMAWICCGVIAVGEDCTTIDDEPVEISPAGIGSVKLLDNMAGTIRKTCTYTVDIIVEEVDYVARESYAALEELKICISEDIDTLFA